MDMNSGTLKNFRQNHTDGDSTPTILVPEPYLFYGMEKPQLLSPKNNPKKQDRKRTMQKPIVRDLSSDTEAF